MNAEAFEQLVSAWLDEPQRDDLRARVEAAAAGDPGLTRIREQLMAIERLVRAAGSAEPAVDWGRVQARISAAIDANAQRATGEARLDDFLQGMGGLESRVDWAKFHQRVATAIDRTHSRGRILRLPGRRTSAAVGLVATAAALWLLFSAAPWEHPHATPVSGVATARVVSPMTAGPIDRGHAVVRVKVEADTGFAPPPSASTPDPDVYFMLEPPDVLLARAPAAGPIWN